MDNNSLIPQEMPSCLNRKAFLGLIYAEIIYCFFKNSYISSTELNNNCCLAILAAKPGLIFPLCLEWIVQVLRLPSGPIPVQTDVLPCLTIFIFLHILSKSSQVKVNPISL